MPCATPRGQREKKLRPFVSLQIQKRQELCHRPDIFPKNVRVYYVLGISISRYISASLKIDTAVKPWQNNRFESCLCIEMLGLEVQEVV